jgi:hypothetical protein
MSMSRKQPGRRGRRLTRSLSGLLAERRRMSNDTARLAGDPTGRVRGAPALRSMRERCIEKDLWGSRAARAPRAPDGRAERHRHAIGGRLVVVLAP